MAELRHSASMGNRSNDVASPVKRDTADDSKPLFPSSSAADAGTDDDSDDGERRRPSARARDHKDLFFHRSSFLSSIRSFLDDPRGFSTSHSRILLASAGFFILLGIVFLPSVWSRWSSPYLCYKDGITLHCPRVKEAPSLWENPHASTASWKPCAERQENGISDLLPENETSGYIFIHAEGGLNQQRIAICNAVAVAKIMNATLILPVLKQDQIWKDKTNFEDIFDVGHFIEYLKDDVRIVREIPDWFTDKTELFTSIRT